MSDFGAGTDAGKGWKSPQTIVNIGYEIVRLLEKNGSTVAASNGCSKELEGAWDDFGYRMSVVPAEAFFADVVLLVEGPSEVLFYSALAAELGIDLDFYNISILPIDGIDFDVYKAIFNKLEIPVVLRPKAINSIAY